MDEATYKRVESGRVGWNKDKFTESDMCKLLYDVCFQLHKMNLLMDGS